MSSVSGAVGEIRVLRDQSRIPQFAGAAANPSIGKYRKNAGRFFGARTPGNFRSWARRYGVDLPPEVQLVPTPGIDVTPFGHSAGRERGGAIVFAEYFRTPTQLPGDTKVYWRSPTGQELNPFTQGLSIVDPGSNSTRLKYREALMKNDEAMLHMLAHEAKEIGELRRAFEGRDFIPRGELASIMDEAHAAAWEFGDKVIHSFRAI